MADFRKLAETLADQLRAANCALEQINERGYGDTEYFIEDTWKILADARNAVQESESKAEASRDFYKQRCELLQQVQKYMRDPERTIVCDILANNSLLPDPEGKRYGLDIKKEIGETK